MNNSIFFFLKSVVLYVRMFSIFYPLNILSKRKYNCEPSLPLALSCNPVERYVHFLQGSTKWSSIYKKSNYMENPKLCNLFVWKSENKIRLTLVASKGALNLAMRHNLLCRSIFTSSTFLFALFPAVSLIVYYYHHGNLKYLWYHQTFKISYFTVMKSFWHSAPPPQKDEFIFKM